MTTIGQRIREIRTKTRFTQEKFAAELNLKQQTIAVFELGKRNPSERTISDICDKFNINEDWLRTGEGEMFNDIDSIDITLNHFGYMMGNASAQKKAVLAALVEMAYSVPDDKWDYIIRQFNNCLKEAQEEEEN